MKTPTIKNSEIPKLDNYVSDPDRKFWEFFPKKEMPKSAETIIDIDMLERKIVEARSGMTASEYRRAVKTVKDLRCGAEAYQKSELPPIRTVNAKSAYDNGEMLTDTIATWVKKGFVAGPFEVPPTAGFRANPLAVVVRNGKIRPILNMSGPIGKSFNDNVDRDKLERLHMGTAKQFSFALKDAGKDAVFSKFDICDAYKLMPAKVEDYRLQGFFWLGRYFVETRQPFGGVPAPCNFDRLGNTKDLIVCILSGTPRNLVFRALDDSPCVTPAGSSQIDKFSTAMRNICAEVRIPLAENCPLAEKAFEKVKKGTVLGIGFDSSRMEWFLSREKAEKVIRRCLTLAAGHHSDLKQIQQVMGSVNDLAQMAPLLRFYKRSGNAFLRKFNGNEDILLAVPEEVKLDMDVIAKVVESSMGGLPIASKHFLPKLSAIQFYTDAAGASFSVVGGKRPYHNNHGKGVSCIAGSSKNDVRAWTRLSWPEKLLTERRD